MAPLHQAQILHPKRKEGFTLGSHWRDKLQRDQASQALLEAHPSQSRGPSAKRRMWGDKKDERTEDQIGAKDCHRHCVMQGKQAKCFQDSTQEKGHCKVPEDITITHHQISGWTHSLFTMHGFLPVSVKQEIFSYPLGWWSACTCVDMGMEGRYSSASAEKKAWVRE